ncbi:MAG TPA: ABC transporter ATP-binding protein [Gemmatimonadales bacterium]
MATFTPVLSAKGLSRRYGYRLVLRDVSLDIGAGDLLLVVGPNGAGKTTLLRLLAGLARPTAGSISRAGDIGMVAHDAMLYDDLTALENLEFLGRLLGLTDPGRPAALLERLGLTQWATERARTFSRGMTQRLAIARALLSDPAVLLLDEPFSGLDDRTSHAVRAVFAERRAAGCALVVVTHNLSEVADVASHVAFLSRGTLLAVEPAAGRDAKTLTTRQRELTGE